MWTMKPRSRFFTVTVPSLAAGALIGILALRYGKAICARVPALALDQALLGHRPQFMFAVLGWAVLSLYWERAAKKAAAAKSSESRASRALHLFAVTLGLLLEFAPLRGLGRWLPASSLIMIAGLAVEATGLFLALWSRRHLGRNWSGEISIKIDHQLIRSGPYKLLRHPIYTGVLTMYAGVAIVTGEWLAIIGLALVVLAYGRKIRLEEANLDVAFGADYAAYRRQTWALLPWLI
jgi:protein-S-isoprenylcysteine O-methyltransferase Ste14